MLRFKDLPEEQRGEVVRVASELYDRETTEARERKATIDAAEEVGIPEAYLERAAAEVHARRVAAVQEKRRKQRIGIGVAAAVVAVGGIGAITIRGQQAPPTVIASVASATVKTSPGTVANLSREGSDTVLTVEKFAERPNGEYFANITLSPPKADLSGYQTVKFTVQGSGLRQIRLDLQNGATERWKGPVVNIPADKQQVSLSLHEFVHQSRSSSSAPWKGDSSRSVGNVTELGFKTGETLNSPDTTGTVAVGDVRFE